MLQTFIPWLADGYRMKLQQREKEKLDHRHQDDNFALCPKERKAISCAEMKLHEAARKFMASTQRQVCSAHARVGGRSRDPVDASTMTDVEGKEEEEAIKSNDGDLDVLISDDDDKENHPLMVAIHTRLQSRPSSAMQLQISRPPTSVGMNGTQRGQESSALRRPASAITYAMYQHRACSRKVHSADPHTHAQRHRVKSAHRAWDEDPRKGLYIGAAMTSMSAQFTDRHARCFDKFEDTRCFEDTQKQEAWVHSVEGDKTTNVNSATSPVREAVMEQSLLDPACRMLRYINCHRPQTAPTTRRELEGTIKKKYVLQNRRTHFCNFVHQVNLHQRNLDSTSETRRQDFEGDYADRTKSLMNGTANRDQLPAPPKGLPSRTPNGLRARPGSPTSETGDYDESSNDLHTADKVKKSKQGEGSATKGEIPVFNIPSFQSKTGEQSSYSQRPQDDSLQSGSGQVSRRKSALKIKDKQTSSSKSGTPDDQESKSGRTRLPISKKSKTKRSDKRNAKEPPMLGDSLSLGGGEHLDGMSDDKLVAEPIDLNLKVPDLPSIPTPNKENAGRQSKHKAERYLIDSIDQENVSLPNELLTLDSLLTNGYDFRDMESTSEEAFKKKRVSWFTDRMAFSQQASRFELPMDMKSLEKMTTQEYLKKYCVVTSRRLNLYQKHFSKHKDRNSHCLNTEGLETCLKEVLVEALKENTLKELFTLLDITPESSIDFSLFSGIAALAERILYPYFTTEDTANKPEYQRENIETVDFEALDWKLHGIKVSDNLRKLLKMIE